MSKNKGFMYLEIDLNANEYELGYNDWYYNKRTHKWENVRDWGDNKSDWEYLEDVVRCKTLRAAKRHIRVHKELPKGMIFRVIRKESKGRDVMITV